MQARSAWRIPGDLGSLYRSWLSDVACRLVSWLRGGKDLVFGPARRSSMSFLVLLHLRDRHRDAKGAVLGAPGELHSARIIHRRTRPRGSCTGRYRRHHRPSGGIWAQGVPEHPGQRLAAPPPSGVRSQSTPVASRRWVATRPRRHSRSSGHTLMMRIPDNTEQEPLFGCYLREPGVRILEGR